MSVKLAASCHLPIQSATGKWQLTSHSGCQFSNPGELATGSQMPILFESVLEHNS